MSFSVYDTSAIQLLSAALGDTMQVVKNSAARPLSEGETASLSKQITYNLMRVFDLGERDPSALNRAALEGICVSTDKSVSGA